MSRRITQLSNLVKLIEKGMISIVNVESNVKMSTDITETEQVTPDKFIESIQYLNEATLFRDGIDFYYDFTGSNTLRIKCGMKNIYLEEYFIIDCSIQEGLSAEDIDAKLRESVFDRLNEKMAV